MSTGAATPGDGSPRSEPGVLARVASWPLEFLVHVYRTLVSPLFPQSCRYYPSCSAYALTALRRFGPFVGSWLAVRRLLRCHPWTPGGVDHVPPRGEHGWPDWAAQRADTARREARWDGTDTLDVGHDDCETGATGRRLPIPPVERVPATPRRGID